MNGELRDKLAELQTERVCSHQPFDDSYISEMQEYLAGPIPDDFLQLAPDIAGCAVFGVYLFRDPKNLFGGHPEWNVEQFLARSSESLYDIIKRASTLQHLLPSELLPIADTSGRNHIVISVSSRRATGVYLWVADHDETEKPTEDSLFFVAPTVVQFILGLKIDPGYSA